MYSLIEKMQQISQMFQRFLSAPTSLELSDQFKADAQKSPTIHRVGGRARLSNSVGLPTNPNRGMGIPPVRDITSPEYDSANSWDSSEANWSSFCPQRKKPFSLTLQDSDFLKSSNTITNPLPGSSTQVNQTSPYNCFRMTYSNNYKSDFSTNRYRKDSHGRMSHSSSPGTGFFHYPTPAKCDSSDKLLDRNSRIALFTSLPMSTSCPVFQDPNKFKYIPKKTASNNLGSLNPELYKCGEEGDHLEFPDDHLGRLWFSIHYNPDSEKLSVVLLKIRNLQPRDQLNAQSCDPYVKVYLSPDERNFCQTKTRRKSCNPRFDENFVFNASREMLQERSLRFVVYDVDSFRRSIPIGYAVYSLKDHPTTKHPKFIKWIDLSKGESESSAELGEIHCVLSYTATLEELTVGIVEANNIPAPRGKDLIDTYARVSCTWLGNKTEKAKKTKVVKKSLNPIYNESFIFRLPIDKHDFASISIQIMQTKHESQLGRVVIGGELCTKGKALDHWKQATDPAANGEVVQMWHSLHS